ncbi:flagellar export protein FliJ [Variovorax dokdonensis]|uniref:Flagellar FliJ protein n=1 Tax=Variovorax dokdonensis TaxID=344883 RepID=A0ABT7N4Y8_9BURK|nr:flagellar export protein FliJ [Variovorax dokdonensis]MDM0042962.1 flagellar export protein FliJ [Variovorax dokdonensis]
MAKQLPLDTLSELARTKTDDAARRLGALQNAQLSAAQKLEMLIDYRQDYFGQLQAQMAHGLSSAKYHNYQAFLATLDGAIDQQRAIVAQAETRLDRGRDDWRQNKRRLNSFDTLIERARRQEQAVQAKREQRDSDERAARGFLDRAVNPTF